MHQAGIFRRIAIQTGLHVPPSRQRQQAHHRLPKPCSGPGERHRIATAGEGDRGVEIGALLTMGVMVGAIASHLLVLGIEVKGDGGLLFGLALTAFVASALVLAIRRSALPLVGRYFELA